MKPFLKVSELSLTNRVYMIAAVFRVHHCRSLDWSSQRKSWISLHFFLHISHLSLSFWLLAIRKASDSQRWNKEMHKRTTRSHVIEWSYWSRTMLVPQWAAARRGVRMYLAGWRWQRTSAGRADRWRPAAVGEEADPACGVADRQTGRAGDYLKGFVLRRPSVIYANTHTQNPFCSGPMMSFGASLIRMVSLKEKSHSS